MRYVLDSSVAFKWFVPEADTADALRLREDFRNRVHELIAPDIFHPELTHALTRAERQDRLNPGDAELHLIDALNLSPLLHSSLPLMLQACRLSSSARVGVYDCLYVALAAREGCEMVSADDRLKRALPGNPIVLLADLP